VIFFGCFYLPPECLWCQQTEQMIKFYIYCRSWISAYVLNYCGNSWTAVLAFLSPLTRDDVMSAVFLLVPPLWLRLLPGNYYVLFWKFTSLATSLAVIQYSSFWPKFPVQTFLNAQKSQLLNSIKFRLACERSKTSCRICAVIYYIPSHFTRFIELCK